MAFKHPEILYGLIALVLPILVHLFQFRKFKTEAFTNVKYLKKVVQETRKSARLKQWLLLFTRLGILAGLIIAFSQPYIPSVSGSMEEETVIYLDNSLSMQARGKNGVLFKQAVQQLLENLPEDGVQSFFTNEAEFRAMTTASLKERLQDIDYAPVQLDWKTVRLKAANLFSERGDVQRNLVVLSDFQERDSKWDSLSSRFNTFLVPYRPAHTSNISIDSAFVKRSGGDQMTLTAILRPSNYPSEDVMISVYNKTHLLSRKTLVIKNAEEQRISFSLPMEALEQGRIQVDDHQGLDYDDQLYFSINQPEPIKVVVVGDPENTYFSRLYQAPEFDLDFQPEGQVDFGVLAKAQLIILSELEVVPDPLKFELERLHKENVTLVLIPAQGADRTSYNSLLGNLGLPLLTDELQQEKLITQIHLDHPLYQGVFEKAVTNFQYPRVNSYFRISPGGRSVLSLDSEHPFLVERNKVYLFSAALNETHSNFQNSPLIVPTFYNMGYQTLSASQLYFTLGKDQTLSLRTELEPDHILKMSSPTYTFIPRQQAFQNSVKLYIEDSQLEPGHYRVLKDSVKLNTLSFNYDRKESQLFYQIPQEFQNTHIENTTEAAFEKLHSSIEVAALWKWFVIFALVSLCIEILILKFFK